MSERARADVDGIFNWLVGRSVEGAISWYLAFRAAAQRITESPELYSVAPESQSLHRAVRQALFMTRRGRRYRIVFDVSEVEVFILRVRGPGQAPLRSRDLPPG
jgi:plasmid stabilization system protein ParE